MSENKSGYELRNELLHLAKDICETNVHLAMENKDVSQPRYFTTDDVIREAEKLYQFVQTKS